MMYSIFSLWLEPRATVRRYSNPTVFSTLYVSLILTIAYFFCFGLLLLFIGRPPEISDLISPPTFWIFSLVFSVTFTALNLCSLVIFFFARTISEATLPKTKAAVHCAALSTIPIAFFISTSIGNKIFGNLSLFFGISSLLLILIFSIYSLCILVLTLSEMYKIRALSIAFFGLVIPAFIGILFVLLLIL